MTVLAQDIIETAEIRGRRAQDKRRAIFTSVLQTQLLFWSWVVGWVFGPANLSQREIALGFLFSVFLGIVSAFIGLRHYLERSAEAKLHLKEGKKKRRLVLYPGYFWLNNEINLRDSIERISVQEDSVTIRLTSSVQENGTERTFSGGPRPLETFQDYLRN